jgi:hypothetical protein
VPDNLIVLASHARSRSLEHAHGEVAARMLEELEAPALVVRPEIERSVLLLASHDPCFAEQTSRQALSRP